MPLYATGGFEDGSLNDAPITKEGRRGGTKRRRGATKDYVGPPEGHLSGKPSELSKQLAKEAELARKLGFSPFCGPADSESEPPSPELVRELGLFPVCSNTQRFGPDGSIYLLPSEGETLDMFKCEVCGRPGHKAAFCEYKVSFPPDGFIARPDWYEVICWCGSLNISPDPPRKCNTCQNGGTALRVRSKQPRQYASLPPLTLPGLVRGKSIPCTSDTSHNDLEQFKYNPTAMI